MVMPIHARESGLRFNAFGFPVRIDPLFFLVMGFLGFGGGVQQIVIWIGVALLAVLAHELGHAFAARASGHDADIVLYGFGGATRHRGKPLSRARNALVAFAGPGVGLLIGAALLLARPSLPQYGYGGYAVDVALFLTLGLGLLNLLPILPLDGGQMLVTVLPGDEFRRYKIAAAVGVVVAVAGGIAAFAAGWTLSLVLAAWLVVGNFMTLRERRPRAVADKVQVESEILALLDDNKVGEAIQLVRHSPASGQLSPALVGLLRLATGDASAWPHIVSAFDASPSDALLAGVFVRAAVRLGQWDALLARPMLDAGLRRWAADCAVIAGREDVADQLTAATP